MLDLWGQGWKVRPWRSEGETPLRDRWLFPGRKAGRAGKPITTRHLNRLFHEAAEAAGIKKSVAPACAAPQLRDSSPRGAAPTSESFRPGWGTIKLETTARYTRVATGMMAN